MKKKVTVPNQPVRKLCWGEGAAREAQGDLSAQSWGMLEKCRVWRKIPATNPKKRSVPSKQSEGRTWAREQGKMVRCQVPTLSPCTGSTARTPPDFRHSYDALSDSCSREMWRGVSFQLQTAAMQTRFPAQVLPQAPQRTSDQGGLETCPLRLIPSTCPRSTDIYCSRNKHQQNHTYFW